MVVRGVAAVAWWLVERCVEMTMMMRVDGGDDRGGGGCWCGVGWMLWLVAADVGWPGDGRILRRKMGEKKWAASQYGHDERMSDQDAIGYQKTKPETIFMPSAFYSQMQ
ncbi:hypothetical protein Tco_0526838 [Tanacetum coccineum]